MPGTQVLSPTNEEQLIEALNWAVSTKTPLNVFGLGSKASFGQGVAVEQNLELSAISGILHYEPSELVLTARAGTPLNQIHQALSEHNQGMAFEPINLGAILNGGETTRSSGGSIGGLVAAGFAGPRRIRQGSIRDHVLGFRAVSGRAELFKSGGKVMKNVTGFDLSKLMAGSMGTLAIMSEVTIKVLPTPEKSRTILVFGLSGHDAILAMRAAVNSPHEVTAAAHIPQTLISRSSVDLVSSMSASVTAVRVEGPGASVKARCEVLRNSLATHGPLEELHSLRSSQFWTEVGDVVFLAPPSTPGSSLWRLSVPPAEGASIAETITSQCGGEAIFDWGGGLVWLALTDSYDKEVRAAIGPLGGHATLIRGPENMRQTMPVFQPQPDALSALSARVKTAFDPYGILNPGRLYPTE